MERLQCAAALAAQNGQWRRPPLHCHPQAAAPRCTHPGQRCGRWLRTAPGAAPWGRPRFWQQKALPPRQPAVGTGCRGPAPRGGRHGRCGGPGHHLVKEGCRGSGWEVKGRAPGGGRQGRRASRPSPGGSGRQAGRGWEVRRVKAKAGSWTGPASQHPARHGPLSSHLPICPALSMGQRTCPRKAAQRHRHCTTQFRKQLEQPHSLLSPGSASCSSAADGNAENSDCCQLPSSASAGCQAPPSSSPSPESSSGGTSSQTSLPSQPPPQLSP